MKAFRYIAIIALALLGLVSCKQEEQEIFASKVTLGGASVDIPVGRTTITTSCGMISASCVVNVVPVEVEEVTQDKAEASLKVGETLTLTATVIMN